MEALPGLVSLQGRITNMIPSALGRLGGVRTVNITSNQTNYNLRTALGSPAGVMRIIVNIASGVTISSSVSTTPAFDEGSGWTAGTLITINNAGNIYGGGGLGGLVERVCNPPRELPQAPMEALVELR